MDHMKELYKDFYKIESYARKGMITLKECNQAMLDAIEKHHDAFLVDDDPQSWDSMKAYHSMYMRLSRLSK